MKKTMLILAIVAVGSIMTMMTVQTHAIPSPSLPWPCGFGAQQVISTTGSCAAAVDVSVDLCRYRVLYELANSFAVETPI